MQRQAPVRSSPKTAGTASYLIALSILTLFLCTGCASTAKRSANEWPPGEPLPPETEQKVQALAHFATGVSNDLNNEPREATDEFLQAAAEDLDEEELVTDVARRLVREQRTQEAIDLLTKASSRPHAAGSFFTWLGIAYLQAGQTNLAIEANQTAIKKSPENLAAYQNLSQLYLQA